MPTYEKNYHIKMNRIKNPKFRETKITKHIESLGWYLLHEYTHTYQSDDTLIEFSEFTHTFKHDSFPYTTLLLYTYELYEDRINLAVTYKNDTILRSNYNDLAIQNNLNEVIAQRLFEVAL